MWVSLTIVSKFLVLNHVCNDVEQPILYSIVMRKLNNVICLVYHWKGAVLLATAQMLYIYILQSCGSFPQFNKKSDVYENRCTSDMPNTFSPNKLCEYYQKNMRKSLKNSSDFVQSFPSNTYVSRKNTNCRYKFCRILACILVLCSISSSKKQNYDL